MKSKMFCILALVLLFTQAIESQAAVRDNNTRTTILFNVDNKNCGPIQSFIDGGIIASVSNDSQSANTYTKKNIAKPNYMPLTIETGFNMDPLFNDWVAKSWEAIPPAKRDCGMEILQGVPPVKNIYKNCTIIESVIPECGSDSKEAGALKFVIDFENIDNSGVLKSAVPALGGIARKWESKQFKLEIDGIDCANVAHIDSFSVKRKISVNAVGELKIPSADAGKIIFPDINVTVVGNGIKSWEDWADNFIARGNNADNNEKNGRLIFYSDPFNTKEIARIEFKNLGIFSLKHDYEANSPSIIAGLYCEQMSFKTTASDNSAPQEPDPETAQQPTDDAQLGIIYAMGGQFPLNFRLNSAEFTTRQVNIGKRTFVPAANEKLLVLHFTLINPAERARNVRFDSLMISCSDETNTTKPAIDWGLEANKATLSNQIEQNQPIDAYTVITLSAKGPANRLTVRANNTTPLLTYNMKDKVTGLKPPIAAPEDNTTAIETVPGRFNEAYPYEKYEITFTDAAMTSNPVLGKEPEKGTRYMIIRAHVKNCTMIDYLLRFDSIITKLMSSSNQQMKYINILNAEEDLQFGSTLSPGGETDVRFCFMVPDGIAPATLHAKEGTSRTYIFKL